MTGLLQDADPACLEYPLSRMDLAIESISKLLEKYSDKPAVFEYYSTMQECLLALNAAMMKADNVQRRYYKAIARIEILEYSLAAMRREKVT